MEEQVSKYGLTVEEGKNIENAMASVLDTYEEMSNFFKNILEEETYSIQDVVRSSIARKDAAYATDFKHSLMDHFSVNRDPYQTVLLDKVDYEMVHILTNVMNSFVIQNRMEIAQTSSYWWMNLAGVTEKERESIHKLFTNNVCINENVMEVYLNKSKHDIAIIDQAGTKIVIPAARDAMFNLLTSEFDAGLWGTPETDKLWIIRFQLDNLEKYPIDGKTREEPRYHIYNKFECRVPNANEEPAYIPEKNILVFNSEAHMEHYLMTLNVNGEKAIKGFIKQKIAEEYFPVAGMYSSMINLSPEQELFTIVLDRCVRIPRVPQSKVEQILGNEIEDKDKVAVLVEANYKEIDNAENHLFYITKENPGFYSLRSKNLNNNTTLGRIDMTSRTHMLEKKFIEPFVLSNGYPVFLSEEECEQFIKHYGKKTGYNVVLNYLSAVGADKAEAIAKIKHDFKWNLRETGKSVAKYLGVVALSSIGTWVVKEMIKKGWTPKEPTQVSSLLNAFSGLKGNPMSSPAKMIKVAKTIKKINKEDKQKIVKEGVKTMGKLRKTGTSLDRARTAVDILKETENTENKTAALIREVKAARKDLRTILKDTGEFLRDKVTKTLDFVKEQIVRFKEWIVDLDILGKIKTVGSKIKNGAVIAWNFTVDKVKVVGRGIQSGWFWLLTKIGARKEIGNGLRFALRFI